MRNHLYRSPTHDIILREDFTQFLSKLIEQYRNRYIIIKRSKLIFLFRKMYPFKYRRAKTAVFEEKDLLYLLDSLGICSSWKLHRKKAKKFKIVRKRVIDLIGESSGEL